MPIPGGEITTTEIWVPKPEEELEQEPAEKVELTEEDKLEIALKLHNGEI